MSNVLSGQQAINSLNFDLGRTVPGQSDGAQVNTQATERPNKADTELTSANKAEASVELKGEQGQKSISKAEQSLLAAAGGDNQKVQMSTEQLEVVAQKLQEFMSEMNRGLEFLVDEDSGRNVIKVIDKNTGDLVKQFPSEDVLDLVAHLSEATGNFVDSKI